VGVRAGGDNKKGERGLGKGGDGLGEEPGMGGAGEHWNNAEFYEKGPVREREDRRKNSIMRRAETRNSGSTGG